MSPIPRALFLTLISIGLLGGAYGTLGHGAQPVHEILGLTPPRVLPGSFLYFFKDFGRRIEQALIRDPVKRAELELRFSDQRLVELGTLISTASKDADAARIEKAFANYLATEKRLEDGLKTLSGENKNVDTLLETLVERSLRHQKVIASLDELDGDKRKQASVAIARNITAALRVKSDVVEKKLSAEVRDSEEYEAFEEWEATEPDLEELGEKLRKSVPRDDRKKKERDLVRCGPMPARPTPVGCTGPICHDSAWEFVCPPIKPPPPAPPASEKPTACIQVYDPVCGVNGKTYSNSCSAGIAEVQVKSKGECPASPRPSLSPPAPAKLEFKLEADDFGFYPSSKIKVAKGSRVAITFLVRTSNVYYAGLDFRSKKFQTVSVKPGESTTVEFDADESFSFSSYWPASQALKATGNVETE